MISSRDRLDNLRANGGCFALTRARVRVSGPDRLRYLNGQLSNDLRRLRPGEAMEALLLTAKGKLCAPVFVWTEDAAIVVDAPADLGEAALARIERYAIADDVTFALETYEGWHVFGAAAGSLAGPNLPRLTPDGRDVDQEPAGVPVATAEEYETLRILAGKPAWGSELTEETLPQEALLEQSSVDFAKGCYVGQEVVSRLKSVGRVNRLLKGFEGRFPAVPADLCDRDGKVCGRLTTCAVLPEGGPSIALGYLFTRAPAELFSVRDESGACLGEAEQREFPLSW